MNNPSAEPGRVPAQGPEAERTPSAKTRRHGWWPGWIWLLPLAAVCIVAYLGINALTSSGPTVHVIFPGAADLKPGDTKVKFQNQDIGSVEAVSLQKDLQHTEVTLSLKSQLQGHLGPDTRFWIVGGSLSLSDPSTLKTIISGPFIGVDPRPGQATDHFTGLSEKPVLEGEPAGHHYRLHEAKLGTLSRGSSVLHLGVKVGEVLDTSMSPNGQGVDVEAFVRAPYDKLVHPGTRFWDASAVSLATGSGGPSVQFQSLPALVSGALAFETPTAARQQEASPNDATFQIFPAESAAQNASSDQALAYRVVFAGPTNILDPGAGVMLAGKRIGLVGDASLDYDAGLGKLLLHAKLLLEPSEMHIAQGTGSPRAQMDAMLRQLIGDGLRAGMGSSPPVIGSQQVTLHFVPHAPAASLGSGDEPEIPSTSGAGVDSIMAQASDVMAKVDALPLDQIGQNVQQATQHLSDLSQAPETTQALRRVNETLANVQRVSASMGRELPSALTQLTRAVNAATALVGQTTEVTNQAQTATVPSTLFEVRRAAKSIRSLADVLDRNPQALITGRESDR